MIRRLMLLCLPVPLLFGQVEGNPVTWSFAMPAWEGKPQAGGSIRVKLKAEIREGWHLYSLKNFPSGGPLSTRITVPQGQPFLLNTEGIEASPPEVVDDPVFGMQVEYYSDEATFELPVKIAGEAKGDTVLKVSLRYQSCNEKICLPPKTVTIETTLPVSSR